MKYLLGIAAVFILASILLFHTGVHAEQVCLEKGYSSDTCTQLKD